MGQTDKQLVWFGLVLLSLVGLVERELMSDHFWLYLVVLVLSTFVFSVLFGVSQTRKKERKKEKKKITD